MKMSNTMITQHIPPSRSISILLEIWYIGRELHFGTESMMEPFNGPRVETCGLFY